MDEALKNECSLDFLVLFYEEKKQKKPATDVAGLNCFRRGGRIASGHPL